MAAETRARPAPRAAHGGGTALALAAAAVLAVATMALGANEIGPSALAFMAAYPAAVAAAALALHKVGDGRYGTLFAHGLSLRLLVVAAWTLFPPTDLVGPFRYAGIVFEDESFYLYLGRAMAAQGLWSFVDLSSPYERAAALYGLIFSVCGDGMVWPRMVNALATSATSVLIYDAIVHTTSRRTHRFGWWLAGFSPELLLWSAAYLKEPYLTLGVALAVNSVLAAAQARRPGWSLAWAALGVALCLWIRGAVLIIPAILGACALLCRRGAARRLLFPAALAGTLGGATLVAAMAAQLAQMLGHGDTIIEGANAAVQSGDFGANTRFPFFSLVSKLPAGPLQSAGFAVLLLINPVITGVFSLLPFLGAPTWIVFAVSAYALSWWICLPLWIACAAAAVKQRDGWWTALAGGLVVWLFVSSSMRAGVGYDAFRYREAMMPLTAVLAARGLDSVRTGVLDRAWWEAALKYYRAAVVGLVLLRGAGVLQM